MLVDLIAQSLPVIWRDGSGLNQVLKVAKRRGHTQILEDLRLQLDSGL